MSAELAARRISAEAVLGDWRRWANGEITGGDWQMWALRLGRALSDVLAWLEIEDSKAPSAAAASWVGPDGRATLTGEDLVLVIVALRAAAEVADDADRAELAALRFRLGDDCA
jgi:hypothetical protein